MEGGGGGEGVACIGHDWFLFVLAVAAHPTKRPNFKKAHSQYRVGLGWLI